MRFDTFEIIAKQSETKNQFFSKLCNSEISNDFYIFQLKSKTSIEKKYEKDISKYWKKYNLNFPNLKRFSANQKDCFREF